MEPISYVAYNGENEPTLGVRFFASQSVSANLDICDRTLVATAHPKVVQSIMRHSDINLTMGRYTHVLRGQESKAVAKLPDLSQPSKGKQRAIATGTDGKTIPENILFVGGQQRISVNSNKQQNRVDGITNSVFERARQDSNLQPSDSKSATLSN